MPETAAPITTIEQAIQEAYGKTNPVVETAKVETTPETIVTPVVEAKVETPLVETSSLNTEKPVVETPVVETPVVTETKVLSFEDELVAKTGGKFKSWSEVQASLDEPKTEFADDFVKQINDLRKEGVNFDANWLATINKDYTQMSEADEILAELWKVEEPGITAAEIQYRLRKEYDLDNWSKEEGEEETEAEIAMGAKMVRDAAKAQDKLIERQNKMKLSPKAENEALKKQQEELDLKMTNNWNDSVAKAASSIDKFQVKVSDTENFDIPIEKADLQKYTEIAKSMFKDAGAPFTHLFDEKTKTFNQKGLIEMIAKADQFEKAVRLARQAGEAKVIKEAKNINMKPDGASTTATPVLSLKEQQDKALAESLIKHKIQV